MTYRRSLGLLWTWKTKLGAAQERQEKTKTLKTVHNALMCDQFTVMFYG